MVFAITSPVGLQFKFCKDWPNPQSLLFLNLFLFFFKFFLLKDSQVKITFRPGCVRVCVTAVGFNPSAKVQKKNLAFGHNFIEKIIGYFFIVHLYLNFRTWARTDGCCLLGISGVR
jgi:hypothetical protein